MSNRWRGSDEFRGDRTGGYWPTSGDQASGGSRIENSGLIHNQTGTMVLSGGGVHSVVVRSDPGAMLKLGGTTEFLPGSTLDADVINFGPGSNSMIRGTVDISGAMTVSGSTWTFYPRSKHYQLRHRPNRESRRR